MKKTCGIVVVLFSVLVLAACGSSSGEGTTTSGGTTATLSTAKAVPSDVVLSSPTESITSASPSGSKPLSIKGDSPTGKPGDPLDNSYTEKKSALSSLMSGAGDCSFTLQMPVAPPPECYGPTVEYQDYPGGGDGQPPQFPVGDLGFWNPTAQGTEACAAAKMNQLVRNVASRIDNMINTLGTTACAANKASITLPAVGDTLNLKDTVNEKSKVSGLTFTQASIKRLADTAEGYEVYFSTVAMTMSFEDGSSMTGEIILKHIPTSSDGSTYKGKLSMRMGTSSALTDDCQPADSGTTMAGTIMYEKTAADAVKYEFNYVPLCGSDTDPFDTNNNISPASTNWLHDWNYGVFNLNPANGTGSAAYAWQAGNGDHRSRVFNISVSGASDGSATGTAYYGFGPDIASTTLSPGTIDGFVCNWAGPNGAVGMSAAAALAAGKGVNKVQKQTLSRAVNATVFSAETSNIKYAPTHACDTSDAAFVYRAVSQGDNAPLDMSNDRTDASVAITNDLVDLSSINFTRPTSPADVGGGS